MIWTRHVFSPNVLLWRCQIFRPAETIGWWTLYVHHLDTIIGIFLYLLYHTSIHPPIHLPVLQSDASQGKFYTCFVKYKNFSDFSRFQNVGNSYGSWVLIWDTSNYTVWHPPSQRQAEEWKSLSFLFNREVTEMWSCWTADKNKDHLVVIVQSLGSGSTLRPHLHHQLPNPYSGPGTVLSFYRHCFFSISEQSCEVGPGTVPLYRWGNWASERLGSHSSRCQGGNSELLHVILHNLRLSLPLPPYCWLGQSGRGPALLLTLDTCNNRKSSTPGFHPLKGRQDPMGIGGGGVRE